MNDFFPELFAVLYDYLQNEKFNLILYKNGQLNIK